MRLALLGLGVALAFSLPASARRTPGIAESRIPNRDPSPGPVTFNKDIAPILFENCATCHRPIEDGPSVKGGDVLCVAGAPFSLLDYESARARAREIAEATLTRAMPPWLPEAGHGEFLNARRLQRRSDRAHSAVGRAGSARGRGGARSRSRPRFPRAGSWEHLTSWSRAPSPTRCSPARAKSSATSSSRCRARRRDTFARSSSAPTTRRSCITPTSRSIQRACHAGSIAPTPGPALRRCPRTRCRTSSAGRRGRCRSSSRRTPRGRSKREATSSSSCTWCRARRPRRFSRRSDCSSRQRRRRACRSSSSSSRRRSTFPLAKRTTRSRTATCCRSTSPSVSVYPHAHYLAKEMRGTATLPDGTVKPLIWIRRWDIRWQDQYRYKDPLVLPKGTTLRMRFTYDNSAANARSPRPPRRVTWGQNSTDEMGALWVEVIPQPQRRRGRPHAGLLPSRARRRHRECRAAGAQQPEGSRRPTIGWRLKYVQAGRVQDAQARLDEALRLAPNDAEAHSNLGTVLQMQGRLAEATPHLADCAEAASRTTIASASTSPTA